MKYEHRPSPQQPKAKLTMPQAADNIEAEKFVAAAIEKAVEITSDDALAIRRLRNSLIEKLFTPDRTFKSWTELKATN